MGPVHLHVAFEDWLSRQVENTHTRKNLLVGQLTHEMPEDRWYHLAQSNTFLGKPGGQLNQSLFKVKGQERRAIEQRGKGILHCPGDSRGEKQRLAVVRADLQVVSIIPY